jgi:hypothetical protein
MGFSKWSFFLSFLFFGCCCCCCCATDEQKKNIYTRYRPFPNENALLRHIDGVHVDGSCILALPTPFPFEGGGVTVWEPSQSHNKQSPTQPPSQTTENDENKITQITANASSTDDLTTATSTTSHSASLIVSSSSSDNSATKPPPPLLPLPLPLAETAFDYPMGVGDMCFLDNAVWHQGNPITAGERWSLVIFYGVKKPSQSRLITIIKKAADEKMKDK